MMSDRTTLLLEHYLKELKLPSFLREYRKLAPSVPRRERTIPTTCCGWPNWISSTATSGRSSGALGPPASPPSNPWTSSTSWPSPR